jgi:hypothetical protein
MESFDFLKTKLEQLSKRFQNVKFRYQYDEFESEHIIEVTPDRVYSGSKEYAIAESEVIKEFVNQFMYESVLFVSDKSVIKVTNDALVFFTPYEILSWSNSSNSIKQVFTNYENGCVDNGNEYNYKLAA